MRAGAGEGFGWSFNCVLLLRMLVAHAIWQLSVVIKGRAY
jgi:hypothetical protein